MRCGKDTTKPSSHFDDTAPRLAPALDAHVVNLSVHKSHQSLRLFTVSRIVSTLGKRIALFRRNAGMTQEQLAEKTAYSVDFIGLVERGVNAPAVERLQDIADALGVQVWELFSPEEKPSKKPRSRFAP